MVAGPVLAAATCADLTGLTLPNISIRSASDVPAGRFAPLPGDQAAKPLSLDSPGFCRVQALAMPTPDSQIGFEVWMPANGWNGKLLGVGNGGYSSVLDYAAMSDALKRGYAAAATDDGHQGEDLKFVIGHPGKIDDWADRAIHVMTVGAKAIIRDRMGRLPARAYFSGCSTGGFQGMAESQRYPDDYDGILDRQPRREGRGDLDAGEARHAQQGRDRCLRRRRRRQRWADR